MSEQFLRCIQEKHTSGSLKPNELDHSGLSLVHQAAKDGQLTCLKWLMKFGGDLEVKSSEDFTPAHYAAGEGHLQILQYLYERKRECISIKNQKNVTPLYLAAQEGQLDCLIWLTKSSSISPDTQTDNGMTPSHAASQEGRMECLRYLIKAAHAQIKMVDNYGCGILHYAAAEGHWKIVKWLINHCGMSVDVSDHSGAIALHAAAAGGHENAIHMLIKCGAVLHSEDHEGKTALDYAIENRHRTCVNVIRNMMFRSPEELRNLKKVRFNELVYTYDIKTPRYRSTNNVNHKRGSSDYWDEVIQSQFDYWRNSPQQTKRQRHTKEKITFYKGRTANLNNITKKEEDSNSGNEKLNIDFKDPPDLLKHLNEGNLVRLNVTLNGELPEVPVRNRSSIGKVPQVPARHSSITAAKVPPPVPARLTSTNNTPPIVPKRTGIPKLPLNSSRDSRDLESRGYKIKRSEPTCSTSKTIDAPIENSTPSHSPIELSFRSHQCHTTQNPLYRENEPHKYTYPKTPNPNTTVNANRRIDGKRGHSNKLVSQCNTIQKQELQTTLNSNSTNSYLPISHINYKGAHKVKLKEGKPELRMNSTVSNGRVSHRCNINMGSSFDSHLHGISVSQYADKNKIRLYSRNLSMSQTKPSTWRSIRNGVSSFFHSMRPRRDQTGRSTWSDPRSSMREDIFSRFSLPRKASRREFEDLFNHSIEGQYTHSKNTSYSSLTSSGKFLSANPMMEENGIRNSIGTSPYDRFRSREKKDSLSGYSEFSADINGSPKNSFESFLKEPPVTSTMRRVRKDKGNTSR